MTKINKSLLTITMCTIFWFLTIDAFAAKIIGCSNCKSDTAFGKIYNFDKKISNLKNDEFVVFWNGYVGTDELIITHKGIIKNSKIIPVSELNINELCVFGITDFPNIDGKYPNTLLNVSYAKKIKSRYFLWKEEFNRNSINEISRVCLGKRKVFLKNNPLETKYKCDLNHSSCKIIKFDGNKVLKANTKSPKTNLNLKGWTNSRICFFAVNDNKTDWTKNYQYIDHIEEAKSRGIDCGIAPEQKQIIVKENSKTSRIREKYLTFNNQVNQNWCAGTGGGSGYQPDSQPLPGADSFFDPCPGKYITKIPFEQVKQHFSSGEGNKFICSLLEDGSVLNKRLKVYFELAKEIKLECNEEPKVANVIIKEDKESKKLAEQRALELKEERARLKAMEIQKKRLEEKTKQLTEQNRLAELNAKKRSVEIAKEVAAQEREKLEKERALRRAEEKARKIAQEKAKQLAAEREKAKKVAKQLELERVIAEQKNKERLKKLDEERKKSEKIAKQLRQERIIAEEKNKERLKKLDEERKKSEKIAEQLRKERKIAEQKAKELEKSQQTQLASIQKEKAKREKLIQEEKKKREELEKKLAELREQNKNQLSKTGKIKTVKLPPEWMPYSNDMSLQQKQFCQLTNRFFQDIEKAYKSKNDIKVNIVHRDRQENMDGLIPNGKISNWIFKVIKIEQVEDGSAAVVLRLQCKSFVGSGQVYTKATWRKKSNKEWRATIPYNDRRFRELAKLDGGQFILGSGTLLEIEAFKPGQIETFYASQQIGEHPLTKGLNLEGELFIADLSYIAALN